MSQRVLIPVDPGPQAPGFIARAQQQFGPGVDLFVGVVCKADGEPRERLAALEDLHRNARASRRSGVPVRVVTVEAEEVLEGVALLARIVGPDRVALAGPLSGLSRSHRDTPVTQTVAGVVGCEVCDLDMAVPWGDAGQAVA